jgi:CrcB protein
VITGVAFVVAAAAGALARGEMGRRWNRPGGFPLGTLVVNVSGALLLGLMHAVAPPIVTVVGVGGLGAYTTMSSFARDTAALGQSRQLYGAVLYVGATCVLGVGAAALGVAMS